MGRSNIGNIGGHADVIVPLSLVDTNLPLVGLRRLTEPSQWVSLTAESPVGNVKRHHFSSGLLSGSSTCRRLKKAGPTCRRLQCTSFPVPSFSAVVKPRRFR